MRRIAARTREVELVSSELVTPSVRQLELRCVDGEPFDFEPGQWVKLTLGEGLARDYSVASPPRAAGDPLAGHFTLLVTRVDGGPGSAVLHALAPGQRLRMLGPSGLFVRDASELEAPALFVATGTGLAPFLSMLRTERAVPLRAPRIILFGARTEADLLARDELTAWAGASALVRYEPTLSRGSSEWAGRRGYVQHHLAELLDAHPSAHLYVCGLRRMVDAVRELARGPLGLDRRRVHSERFDA